MEAVIRDNLVLLDKAADTDEERFTIRVLRNLNIVRKKLTESQLSKLITLRIPHDSDMFAFLSTFVQLETNMETEEKVSAVVKKPCPEIQVYLQLLVVIYLLDNKEYLKALTCVNDLVDRCAKNRKYTLSHLSAKAWFYCSRIYELRGHISSIRSRLFAALRTATLKQDEVQMAMLINLLLRNFLCEGLYEPADKLVSKTQFPDRASNSQLARYCYYVGRIRAVQLDYSESYEYLEQALKKAPTVSAVGFRLAVHKIACVVQLLLGDIPDKAVFKQKQLAAGLKPYLAIAEAVRSGDPLAFSSALEQHSQQFMDDKNYSLVSRLRNNVIKTGLRRISISYSKISLDDVAEKLCLGSGKEAEAVVAKAIKDNVINATIDHENSWVTSKANVDVHSTSIPAQFYHKRIEFCLKVHSDSVKAMRYPPKVYKSNDDEKERKEQKDKATEIAEEAKSGKFDGDEDEDMME